jgi:hypothetical protein
MAKGGARPVFPPQEAVLLTGGKARTRMGEFASFHRKWVKPSLKLLLRRFVL